MLSVVSTVHITCSLHSYLDAGHYLVIPHAVSCSQTHSSLAAWPPAFNCLINHWNNQVELTPLAEHSPGQHYSSWSNVYSTCQVSHKSSVSPSLTSISSTHFLLLFTEPSRFHIPLLSIFPCVIICSCFTRKVVRETLALLPVTESVWIHILASGPP